MEITFDPSKRAATLAARGLDFADAAQIFTGRTLTRRDDRFDYGEDRYITAGFLLDRFIILVWTPRGADRHVISMRYAHGPEQRRWHLHLG